MLKDFNHSSRVKVRKTESEYIIGKKLRSFDLFCIFETTNGVLELRFLFVTYFLESTIYYQSKEREQTIPTIPNT